ncbi:MAG TPA: hypothetical protein VNZ05_01650 [Solirubrobacteraceae bacterium]|nr:hypothetical protein [Solirubrobacteraceae bacterium]
MAQIPSALLLRAGVMLGAAAIAALHAATALATDGAGVLELVAGCGLELDLEPPPQPPSALATMSEKASSDLGVRSIGSPICALDARAAGGAGAVAG